LPNCSPTGGDDIAPAAKTDPTSPCGEQLGLPAMGRSAGIEGNVIGALDGVAEPRYGLVAPGGGADVQDGPTAWAAYKPYAAPLGKNGEVEMSPGTSGLSAIDVGTAVGDGSCVVVPQKLLRLTVDPLCGSHEW